MRGQPSVGASGDLGVPRSGPQGHRVFALSVASQETLEDLVLRLQLVRRERRGLELQEAALRAQGPVHTLLLVQLQWERAQLQTRGASSSGGGSSGGSSGDEEAWSQVSGSAGPRGAGEMSLARPQLPCPHREMSRVVNCR